MRLRKLIAVGASAAMALTLVACGGAERTEEEPREGAAMPETTAPGDTTAGGAAGTAGGTRVAEVTENPQQFLGRTITMEAEVDRVLGPRAFYLDEESPTSGGIDRDLLVLTRSTADAAAAAQAEDQWVNERVRVTGTVGTISVVEVEREVGWDLDPQIEAELEKARAVVFADSVQRMQP